MGEETKNHRTVRKHHAPAHKKKPEQKRKPQPKGPSSQKPMARAPDAKPQERGADELRRALKAGLVAPTTEQRDAEKIDEDTEKENPVSAALSRADQVHLGAATFLEREAAGGTYAELAEEMAESSSEFWEGTASTGKTAFAGASAGFGMISIGGGIMEMFEGREEMKHNFVEGSFTFGGGLATVGSGVAEIASFGGVAAAGPAAPILGGLALGSKIGREGDKQVKELGWLHNSDGDAETASAWMGDNAEKVEEKVEGATGNHTLGVIAGTGSIVAQAGAGAVVATAAAGNSKILQLEEFGRGRGRRIANEERTESYFMQGDGIAIRDPRTNQVTMTDAGSDASRLGAQQLADYDDKKEDAVDRSKLLHPRQWGLDPNAVSVFNDQSDKIYAATHKKQGG